MPRTPSGLPRLTEFFFKPPQNRHPEPRFPDEGRVPHISLVFREMWDTANVDR